MHTNHGFDASLPDEPFADYAAAHDPEYATAWSELPSKTRKRKNRNSQSDEVTRLTEQAEGLEAGFQITYQPARYEAEWLLTSLRSFYDQALITDVLAQVKGGKEANVYRCAAHPSTGREFLAAKVYRPRKFRNLRNDKIYREGRTVLDINGRPVKEDDARAMRALEKGTAFGAQLAHTSWLMYEFNSLFRLHAAGAAVPQPIGSAENALLMEYLGDAQLSAPTLHQVSLGHADATRLFADILYNVELMLTLGMVHGDLSAYNILYWDGRAVLIDFPQVVDSKENSHARAILTRDIERICEYFAHQGVASKPGAIVADFWRRYSSRTRLEELADLSRWAEKEEEEEDESR